MQLESESSSRQLRPYSYFLDFFLIRRLCPFKSSWKLDNCHFKSKVKIRIIWFTIVSSILFSMFSVIFLTLRIIFIWYFYIFSVTNAKVDTSCIKTITKVLCQSECGAYLLIVTFNCKPVFMSIVQIRLSKMISHHILNDATWLNNINNHSNYSVTYKTDPNLMFRPALFDFHICSLEYLDFKAEKCLFIL